MQSGRWITILWQQTEMRNRSSLAGFRRHSLRTGSCLRQQRGVEVNKQSCMKENKIKHTGNSCEVHKNLDDYVERVY